MTKDVDILLAAINLADMDGLKKVEVSIKDLQVLRKAIQVHSDRVQGLILDNEVLRSKLALKGLDRPVRLDVYI